VEPVRSTPLARQGNKTVFNASGVVPVSSSRFVFIDNRDPMALYELNLNPDGTQHGLTVKRPIVGLDGDELSDPEGIARIDRDGGIDLVVASSLCVRSVTSERVYACDGLVRIRYTPHGVLHAEAMQGFRDWLITGHPVLTDAARLTPDQRGLNVEGLAWDPSRRALLFGIRSPVLADRILVLCIYLDTGAPWNTAALRVGPTLSINKSDFPEPQGIRDIDYDTVRQEFLVVVGRSIGGTNVPFELCTWDGTSSALDVLDVTFEPTTMKPEGVTTFPGNGSRKILIVDDASGFAILSPA
jgi:hypothetical protein